MTKNISEEELLLRKRARRRLVGAVTLVVAAVIILPMIFDEPMPEQYEINIRIPSEDEISDSEPLLLPSDDLPISETFEQIDPVELFPKESLNLSQDNHYAPDTLISPQGIPIPKYKPKPKIDKKNKDTGTISDNSGSIAVTSGFVVQLGAFSNQSKAMQQQQGLLSNGIKAYTETLNIDHKEMTRVRVGPFATRNAAEAELEKLKKLGLNGVVTTK